MVAMTGSEIGLFFAGDVMLGRGIDQILPCPGDPVIHEEWRRITDARRFVDLAEKRHGKIPVDRGLDYVWGDFLPELEARKPDLRIINLETSITSRGEPWPDKRICYRMHPRNVDVLKKAKIDFCALANNHVLDWGYQGLLDTVEVLKQAGIRYSGAGNSILEAGAPAILEVQGKGRVLVFSLATTTSGVPVAWGSGWKRAGINLIDLNNSWANHLRDRIREVRQPGDIVIASIHWGGNYGQDIHPSERVFAHKLIDEARVDLVHGHSSHHVKGIEVYREKLILYGCGDLINDYEGIPKAAERQVFEPDLGLMYFVKLSTESGNLEGLEMIPVRMRQLRLQRGSHDETSRLSAILNRAGKKLGTMVNNDGDVLSLAI